MKGLLGIKVGMTQVFDESGTVTPVTIVRAGPCYVTQVKNQETDGYDAVQVGFEETKEKRLSGGQKGHLGLSKRGSSMPSLRHLREFRAADASDYQVGQLSELDPLDSHSRRQHGTHADGATQASNCLVC